MIDKDVLDDLGRKVSSLLPDSSQQMRADVETNIRAMLQSALSKMNLVTREEFDIQAELLKRTRERLDALQQRLDELEQDD